MISDVKGRGEPSLEENLNTLESLVKKLEKGDLPLDEAIEAYAEGMALSARCRERLDAMTAKVAAIAADARKNTERE